MRNPDARCARGLCVPLVHLGCARSSCTVAAASGNNTVAAATGNAPSNGVVESLVAATKLLKLAALHVVSHAHGVRAVPHRMDRISLCVLYGYHALCSTNVRSFNLVGVSANAH